MRISDWSSDVCSSDLFPLDDAACSAVRSRLSERFAIDPRRCPLYQDLKQGGTPAGIEYYLPLFFDAGSTQSLFVYLGANTLVVIASNAFDAADGFRSEEHTSELQSLMRTPYAVFCLKTKQ